MSVSVHLGGITRSFGEGAGAVMALRGVDLDVYVGELLMLVGPSGCGKTTLISIIAGILNHDDGYCSVLGRHYRDMTPQENANFRGTRIGFVFQSYNLIPALTIAENVAVPLLIHGEGQASAVAKARHLLDRIGLGNRTDELPNKLSGGQQQRVAIARALIHDPALIVCDEPTSALDHKTGNEIMELLRGLARHGERSLIVVTHDSRIFSFADRIAYMDDGRIEKIESMVGTHRRSYAQA